MKSLKFIVPALFIFLLSFVTDARAQENFKLSFGVEGGGAWADIGAEHTAQTIANLSGSTVTYEYDEATWIGRVFVDLAVHKNVLIEAGFFHSGSLDATYTLNGATVTEGYTMRGVDASVVLKPDAEPLFIKAGIHSSEVSGDRDITIGGTTYAANAAESGVGGLLGIGFQSRDKGLRAGITYYDSVGGMDDADVVMGFVGYKF
jgi:hypothetical protein